MCETRQIRTHFVGKFVRSARFIVQTPCYPMYNQIGKGQNTMEHKIIWVRGHVEVYDAKGEFCFSADNEREAWEELREIA